MSNSLQSGIAKKFQVVRYNRRVLYVFGLVVFLILMAAFVALSAQRNNGLLKYAEAKEMSAPVEPWYKNKPNGFEAKVIPTPLPQVPLQQQTSLIQQKEPEDLTAKRKREEEFQAIRASSRVTIAQPNFKVSGSSEGSDGSDETKKLEDLLLAGLGKPQDSKPAAGSFLDRAQNESTEAYLNEKLEPPRSIYEVKAGSVIPAAMLTGINSDLPGQLVAQVTQNVFDTVSGQFLLIPQGARLIGMYDSQVAYGQERVLIAWKRLIFPDGKSILIKGMPGADEEGYAGFRDLVNNHYGRIFGSAVMMSIITGGIQLSQPQEYSYRNGTSPGQELSAALGQNLGQVSAEMVEKNMNIAPTLEIRPGFLFNVMATRDVVFPEVYVD